MTSTPGRADLSPRDRQLDPVHGGVLTLARDVHYSSALEGVPADTLDTRGGRSCCIPSSGGGVSSVARLVMQATLRAYSSKESGSWSSSSRAYRQFVSPYHTAPFSARRDTSSERSKNSFASHRPCPIMKPAEQPFSGQQGNALRNVYPLRHTAPSLSSKASAITSVQSHAAISEYAGDRAHFPCSTRPQRYRFICAKKKHGMPDPTGYRTRYTE